MFPCNASQKKEKEKRKKRQNFKGVGLPNKLTTETSLVKSMQG